MSSSTSDTILRAVWLWHVNTKKNDKLDCLRELERTYLRAKLAKRTNIQKQLKLLDSPGGIVVPPKAASKKAGKQVLAKRSTVSKKKAAKRELIFPPSQDNGDANGRVLPVAM
jgi:hypothetical protein